MLVKTLLLPLPLRRAAFQGACVALHMQCADRASDGWPALLLGM